METFFAMAVGNFSLAELCAVALCVGIGGILRGAAGFGFSLTSIVTLTIFMPPAQAVPLILLWEILASIGHLPFVYRQVDWKTLRWLTLGVLLGTPVGVWVVVVVPPVPMVLGINALVVVLTACMLRGYTPSRAPTNTETAGIGLVCGVINGASANGGPPVILLFLASPAGAAAGRASLIAFFLITDAWASVFYWTEGLLDLTTLLFAALFLPALGLGVWIGTRIFAHLDERLFKRTVLILLMIVAIVGVIRSL